MCGRYASSRHPEDLVEIYEVEQPAAKVLEPDFNVAPTKEVYAVLERLSTPRQLAVATWGLIPSWAKDPRIGSKMINARGETAAGKPAFRAAFAKRRCILPADGYFEWYQGGVKGQQKQPFYLSPADSTPLSMAGLYEIWRDPTRGDDDPARYRMTTTVLTTTAEDSLGHIHERMPHYLRPEAFDEWLDPTVTDAQAAAGLLATPDPGYLVAVPVSTQVNSVRNNGPHLLTPLPLENR